MANFWEDVKRVFDAYGVPAWIWYPIAWAESRGDPSAIGDGGCSIGLFQLNTCVGQGAGYNAAQLKDPLFNAQIAAVRIGRAWAEVKGTDLPDPVKAYNVARLSGHPLTGDFQNVVADFIASGSKIGSALAGDVSGIVLQGPGSIGGGAGAGLSALGGIGDLADRIASADWLSVILVAGGVFVVVLVIVSFVFQSGSGVVREVIRTKKEIGV